VATWLIAGEDQEDMDLRMAELGLIEGVPLNMEQGHADWCEMVRLNEQYGVTSITRTMHWSGATVAKRYYAQRSRGRDAVVEDVTDQVLADG
jgi:hypothetical protein